MAERTSSPLCIVVIDDSPADTDLLRIALDEIGLRVDVRVIADGVQALAYFDNSAKMGLDCDLVLLDLNIPIINGFEILERVKSNPNLKRVPVIVFSSSSSHADIDRCYRSGANSYLSKPSGLQDFIGLVGGLVEYWLHWVKLPSRATPVRASSRS
jgi:two-component system, chemotaxis family, response regulator Rcp1